jgi:putative transposase
MTTQTYRGARHSASLLHTHLVFVTKYRRRALTDTMLNFCQHTMRTMCDELDAELVEYNDEADRLHLLADRPPRLAISALVQPLKGHTADAARREYTGTCVRARKRRHLRPPPYLAVSRGATPLSIIK